MTPEAYLTTLGIYHYLILSSILFVIGAYGIMTSKNAIKILMCIEIMLNTANINLVAFSRYLGDISGQLLTTFSIAIAAAEAAVGLAIVVALYKLYKTVDITKIGDERRW